MKTAEGNIYGEPGQTAMDMLLWRHAEAEDGRDDLQRRLTERGERQAAVTAAWLSNHLSNQVRILVSPAVRTRQTAGALGPSFEIVPQLAPGATAADLLVAADWPAAGGTVLIVGHQPCLGQTAALLLSGREADWAIKKGAVWWLSRRIRNGTAQTVLRAVMPPDLCANQAGRGRAR